MARLNSPNHSYDAWLHWNLTYRCTLDCAYCFFHGSRYHGPGSGNAFTGNGAIDIPSLVKTLEQSERTFRISFTGGEPFTVSNFTAACAALTGAHFISVITNLVTGDMLEFIENIDPRRVLDIVASLHVPELEKHGLADRYIRNYLLLRKRHFPVAAVAVAYPPLAAKAGSYREYFAAKGIPVEFAPFEGLYRNRRYPEAYTADELLVFGMRQEDVKRIVTKGRRCNAGYSAAVVTPRGRVQSCFQNGESLGSIYHGFTFKDEMTVCRHNRCACPLFQYDAYLYERALDRSFRGTGNEERM